MITIDLDSIFNDGTLFGCDIICNLICEDEIPQFKLDYYREDDGKHYILDCYFDWKHWAFILSYIKFENGIPYKARVQTDFHMLFEVKTGLEQVVFKHAAESIIREVENLINDDKEDNRHS
jgi:sRNA-binding regulator protein Hfq